MAFEDLLEQKCNIYHLGKIVTDMGYGITKEDYGYPDTPDLENIPCHLNVEASANLEQTEVENEYIYTGKPQLPVGTDVRINDRIIDVSTGLEYYAQVPRNIRNHHIVVMVQRKGLTQAALYLAASFENTRKYVR